MRRPNRPDQWAISRRIAHPGLVSIDDFQTALAVNTTPMPRDGVRRDYRLTGLLRCALCHRRLDAHWVNHRPGYRCRHGHTSAKPASTDRLPNLYVREDHAMRETVVLLEDLGHQCLTSARLGDYLRHHQMMIICGPGTFSIEPTQSTTAGIPTQRSSTGQANAQ